MYVTKSLKASVGTAALAVILSGCGIKQDSLDSQLAAIRQDMEQGDEAVANRVGETDRRLTNDIADINDRLRGLEQELQTIRSEFDARIVQIEAAIRFDAPVHFAYDSYELRGEDRPILDRLAAVINRYYEGATVTVEGFTDPAGSAEYNLWLGKQRAEAVVKYLTGEQGLDAERVRAVSYGEAQDRQIDLGKWGDDGLSNRRVAFVIDYLARATETIAVGANR